MSLFSSARETTIPTKRSAPSDIEPYRLSRSMTAEDPQNRNLLLDTNEPPAVTSLTKRRVNPESLAIRLGPDLVAELESFVRPGVVEMPSFAIRQEIQIRHNVDRRHIYDWFHSKGLRVTKEDKRVTVDHKVDATRIQERRRRCVVPVLPAGNPRSRPTKPLPVLKKPAVSLPNFTLPLVQKQTFASLPQDWTSARASHVIDHLVPTSFLSSRPPPGTSSTFRDPHIDTVCPILDLPLDEAQRQIYYDTLARVLGPADGLQECVGSYSSYMDKQTEIFYEGLGSCSSPWTALLDDGCLGVSTPSDDMDCDSSASSSSELESVASLLFEEIIAISSGDSDSSLELDDPLISQDEPAKSQPAPTKTVTFAPPHRALLNFSSLLSSGRGSTTAQSSSSLAGALGELPASSTPEDARRKSREWTRPRMGRARAYSGAGGM